MHEPELNENVMNWGSLKNEPKHGAHSLISLFRLVLIFRTGHQERRRRLSGRAAFGLLPIRNRRIGARVQQILVRVPEISVGFVHLRGFLLLLLDRGQTFLLLVSHPGGLSRFATNQDCRAGDQANELKLFHISGLYRVTHESSLPFAR